MRKVNKRHLCAMIAGFMAIVMICLGVLWRASDVSAKDTLEGIRTVIKDNSDANPFTILQIVPDDATVTVAGGVLLSGNTIRQSMGTIGYYIGGGEPIQLSKDLAQFSGSVERRNYVNRLYDIENGTGVLAPITDVSANNASKLLSFSAYQEKYESELLPEQIEAGLLDGTLHELDYSSISGNHIDQITGISMVPDVTLSGNFVKEYVPSVSGDAAVAFFEEETSEFSQVTNTGGFDPGFRPITNEDSSKYLASFRAVPGRMGYVVTATENVAIGVTDWTEQAGIYYSGKAVYRMVDGIYEYVGIASENGGKLDVKDVSGNCVTSRSSSGVVNDGSSLSSNETDNPEDNSEDNPEDAPEPQPTVSDNGSTPEPTVSGNGDVTTVRATSTSEKEISDQDVSENQVSENEPPEEEEPVINEEHANAGNTSYYLLTFGYTNEAEAGTPVYGVSDYTKADNGIYAIDATRPLVPNISNQGAIDASSYEAAHPECFAYRFLRGAGNYLMNRAPEETGIYRIMQMRVFYTGGFTNNEWFKKNVFDRDAGEQCTGFYIEVQTKQVSEVTLDDFNAVDFVYLSNPDKSLLPYQDQVECQVYGTVVEGGRHDLNLITAISLIKRVVDDKLPIIVDQSILATSNDTVKNSNVYRLANALRLDDLKSFYTAHANKQETELEVAFNSINDTQTISDNHYVRENRYSYALALSETVDGGANDVIPLLNTHFNDKFSDDTIAERFLEVLEDIRNENLYRETDGNKTPLPEDVTEATTIRYIINYAQKRVQVEKSSIHILELQPCASYDLDADNVTYKDGTRQKNRGTLYYKRGGVTKTIVTQDDTKITLTQMTTAEFVGKVEDINATYDMIYIGLNTGLMNTVNGSTVYNDTTMDGMVYTNVGDYLYVQPTLAGILNIDYIDNDRSKKLKGKSYIEDNPVLSRYRYSGNDINEEKRKAIEDFIAAGYPVVIEDDMVKESGSSGARIANEDILDNSSYMYELIKNMRNKKNLICLSDLTGSLFNWYLNLSKPTIAIAGVAADAKDIAVPLAKSVDGYYWLNYRFSFTNSGAADTDAACDCKLYVDINADGKFSRSNERVGDIVITNSTGEVQSADNDGKYSLEPNKEYYVRRGVSDEYAGVIPWKLELTQRSNSSRRTNATGYYEIKRTEKEKINILQITSAKDGNGNTNNNLDLAKSMSDPYSMFYHYITALDSFDISITSMASNEYKTAHDEYYNGLYAGGSAYLDQYDMLIIGFADVYREADNSTGAMTAIRDYINAGRSILFTHDTTSISNVERAQYFAKEKDGTEYFLGGDNSGYNKETHWGYSFNSLIRSIVGMDRYGVRGINEELLRRGTGFDSTDSDWSKLTDKTQNGEKDIAYVPGSNRKAICPEVQGFSYMYLNFMRYKSRSTYMNYNTLVNDDRGQYDGGNNVKRVNSGQITTYPYTLDPVFPVSKTHAQYYQLDLEADEDNDGESDIVVWYTINDEDINRPNDIYQASPGDVRNNYYIYNKGNVTYSGVGHSGIERRYSQAVDANEVKLFINTMIAAYRAGLRAPKISILENKEYTSRKISNIYLSYDDMLEKYREESYPGLEPVIDGIVEQTENVFFTADNVSFVEGEQLLSARYFYASDDADAIWISVTGQEEQVKVKELTGTCPLFLASNDTPAGAVTVNGYPAYEIDGSKVYKFSFPTAILPPEAASKDIYVQVTATLRNTSSGRVQSISGTKSVKVIRTQLFNLD